MGEPTPKQYLVWIVGTAVAMAIAGALSLLGVADFETTWQAILRFIDGVFN
jgi:hypothetical protein